MIYSLKYFFITEKYIEGRKTPILEIENNSGIKLGEIKWHGAWRKFCFFPEKNTIWDNNCLNEIIKFIDKYNSEYKNKKQ